MLRSGYLPLFNLLEFLGSIPVSALPKEKHCVFVRDRPVVDYLDIDLSKLRRLGIDEIALRKGQEDFVVVLVDLDSHKLIGMAKSRRQEDALEGARGMGNRGSPADS